MAKINLLPNKVYRTNQAGEVYESIRHDLRAFNGAKIVIGRRVRKGEIELTEAVQQLHSVSAILWPNKANDETSFEEQALQSYLDYKPAK